MRDANNKHINEKHSNPACKSFSDSQKSEEKTNIDRPESEFERYESGVNKNKSKRKRNRRKERKQNKVKTKSLKVIGVNWKTIMRLGTFCFLHARN